MGMGDGLFVRSDSLWPKSGHWFSLGHVWTFTAWYTGCLSIPILVCIAICTEFPGLGCRPDWVIASFLIEHWSLRHLKVLAWPLLLSSSTAGSEFNPRPVTVSGCPALLVFLKLWVIG